MTVVLDASAVLALLLGEAGAAKVAGVLAGSKMSAVNLSAVRVPCSGRSGHLTCFAIDKAR